MMIADTYEYGWGYILLGGLDVPGLPDHITVDGNELQRKGEFHISLVSVSRLASLIDSRRKEQLEKEIVDFFTAYIEHTPLTDYEITDRYRLVKSDIRVTVIVMVEMPALALFFAALSEKFSIDLPVQPAHITLYTLQPEKGIGILSGVQLERDSVPVEIPELSAK